MPESSWVKTLAAARRRPEMYHGGAADAHLRQGIAAPLLLLWEAEAFIDPRRAAIAISPHQYHLTAECGALLPQAERLVEWQEWDTLLGAFAEMQRRLDGTHEKWACRLSGSTFYFGGFASPLLLAERGALALRGGAGLWCQTYEHGWPRSAPFVAEACGASTGLMVAASLSPRWFPGLPYTPDAVEKAIPQAARPHVTVEWHGHDDIVLACRTDPRCVLDPGNIGHWL